MPFSKASFSGNQVESNLDSNHSNPTMKLVCLGGLPTFVPFAFDLSKVHVLIEEIDEPLQKEQKRTMMSLASAKIFGLHSFPRLKC